MIPSWRKFSLWLAFLLIVEAIPVFGESNLAQLKERVLDTLNKGNYWAEYTQTNFRFGRRQETTTQVWVKDHILLYKIESPLWQRGEVTLETENRSFFYIPTLNTGLKLEYSGGKTKRPVPEWQSWLDKVNQLDGETNQSGRAVWSLSGSSDNNSYRVYIDKELSFPVGFDSYRRGILTQSFRFQQVKKLPNSFNPDTFFPENVKWQENESKFWQTVSIPRVQLGVNFPIGQPSYLPDGYRFVKASIEELSQATVVHLLYENGVHQKISIFERERLSDKQRFSFEEFVKAGQAVYVYQFFYNQVSCALVGGVSVDELKKIAASIK